MRAEGTGKTDQARESSERDNDRVRAKTRNRWVEK